MPLRSCAVIVIPSGFRNDRDMARQVFKALVPVGLLALLSAALSGGYFMTCRLEWLQLVALEIQAACRDTGTQWMVVLCLLSYLITFLVLAKRLNSTPHPNPSPPAPLPSDGRGWRRALPNRGGEGVSWSAASSANTAALPTNRKRPPKRSWSRLRCSPRPGRRNGGAGVPRGGFTHYFGGLPATVAQG